MLLISDFYIMLNHTATYLTYWGDISFHNKAPHVQKRNESIYNVLSYNFR